jgi:hypothetical protein
MLHTTDAIVKTEQIYVIYSFTKLFAATSSRLASIGSRKEQKSASTTWHTPPPTPLLPALTLSAGEYRVSGGASTHVSSPEHDLAWQLPASTAPPGNQAIAIEAPIVLRVDIGSAVKQQPQHHLVP